MKYNIVVSGGTFDRFHTGHKEFLRFQLAQSKKVLIGVTSDSYIGTFKDAEIEKFSTRKRSLVNFLKEEGVLERVEIAEIDSIFIPEKWSKLPIDALVVTEETKKSAPQINKQRIQNGLNALEVVSYVMVRAEDGGIISSSRIRNGEINRDGRLFIKKEWLKKTLYLTKSTRKACKRPFGKIITSVPTNLLHIISVGDISTYSFTSAKYYPDISVVDLLVKRKKKFANLQEFSFLGSEEVVKAENQPGGLTPDLFKRVAEAFKNVRDGKKVIIHVHGEEDLAVLPIILASPLGYCIFYGQPNRGMVQVQVTEQIKEKAYSLVSQFSQKGPF